MKKQIKKEHSTLSSYQLRRRTVEAPYKLEPSSNYYIENSNLSQKKISQVYSTRDYYRSYQSKFGNLYSIKGIKIFNTG